MQQLEKRDTYTPLSAPPPARCNCDQSLKALRGRSGVAGLKTFSNNPDEDLTGTSIPGQNLRVSVNVSKSAPLFVRRSQVSKTVVSPVKHSATIFEKERRFLPSLQGGVSTAKIG